MEVLGAIFKENIKDHQMMHLGYIGVGTLLANETPQHKRSGVQSRQHHLAMLTALLETCFKGLRLAIMRLMNLMHEVQSLATPRSLLFAHPYPESITKTCLAQQNGSALWSKGQEHAQNEWSKLLHVHPVISSSIGYCESTCMVDELS